MSKKFKLLTSTKSVEVSLCSKYNSGANKQTQFEIVKDKEDTTNRDVKEVLRELKKYSDMAIAEREDRDEIDSFIEFIDYWLEYDVDNALYNVLSGALQQAMAEIQYEDCTKEEKEQKYINLFNLFLTEYKNFPITKTKEGKYQVSLAPESHNQDVDANPQNETDVITKEKTSEMEKQEQLNIVQKAFDTIANALGLKKTETPAEQQEVEETTKTQEVEEVVEAETKTEEAETVEKAQEVEEVAETEEVEKVAETEEVKEETETEKVEETVETEAVTEEVDATAEKAEVEAPVVEEEVEEVKAEEVEKAQDIEEAIETEKVDVEALVKAKLDAEKELAELKKANELQSIEIEKMSFIQKAKDEFSMLVGTPEEIGAKLYDIAKSNLGDEVKSFVLEQFKKVAKENEELTQEIGSITKNAGDMTEEDMLYAKAKELAKAKKISINKALREIQ